jgi:hypothetical protein
MLRYVSKAAYASTLCTWSANHRLTLSITQPNTILIIRGKPRILKPYQNRISTSVEKLQWLGNETGKVFPAVHLFGTDNRVSLCDSIS